jgi:hypothetical protein
VRLASLNITVTSTVCCPILDAPRRHLVAGDATMPPASTHPGSTEFKAAEIQVSSSPGGRIGFPCPPSATADRPGAKDLKVSPFTKNFPIMTRKLVTRLFSQQILDRFANKRAALNPNNACVLLYLKVPASDEYSSSHLQSESSGSEVGYSPSQPPALTTLTTTHSACLACFRLRF